MLEQKFWSKVLIIGSGPAGYTASIYTARSNLRTILLLGDQPGGQMTVTTNVENYPGFASPVQGPWLMDQMRSQAESVGVQVIHDTLIKANFLTHPFICYGSSGSCYESKSVIVSTGSQVKWLGIPSESKFRGYGVSSCAICDGFFFRNKEVAVIGGGNSAVEEAIFLSKQASKVTVVHRRDTLRAEKILQDRLLGNSKITVQWNHVVEQFTGSDEPTRLTGLTLRHVKDETLRKLNISGAFIAIGHQPSTELFKEQLKMDKGGYILCKDRSTTMTSVPGVFAAGDVRDPLYRQAVTAAGYGCMAAIEVEQYLAEQSLERN